MFLFIFESIGTSELLLVGVVALIFLGPRKLPEMARTIGKYMAEFRRTTNEFKSTWEREVDLENYEPAETPKPVARVTSPETPSIAPPEIKELDEDRLKSIRPDSPPESKAESPAELDKRSWL